MASSPAVSKQSFFSSSVIHAAPVLKTHNLPAVVDVGGDGDCGFRSVAAALLDNVMNNKRVKSDLLGKILNRHFAYYPQHRSTMVGLISPVERIQQLLKDVSMAELIQTLGYTLRQIAVDEMNASPANYRGAFVKGHEKTSPEMMRKSTTWIDETAIAALANNLDMPIEVKVTKQGKELPMRLKYNENGANPGIKIQLQGEHYVPFVANTKPFVSVATKVVRTIHPVMDHTNDHSLEEVMELIKVDDARLLYEFENNKNRLHVMVEAGEITKADLLHIYIKAMSNSDYLEKHHYYVGTERGTASFFEMIEQRKQGVNVVPFPAGVTHEKMIVEELISAISRAVSIGHMNQEEVFAQIDNTENCRRVIV